MRELYAEEKSDLEKELEKQAVTSQHTQTAIYIYYIPIYQTPYPKTETIDTSTTYTSSENKTAPETYNTTITNFNADTSDPENVYKSLEQSLGVYFQEFLERKGYTLAPTYFEGTKDLGSNILGQALITSDIYGPLESRISLDTSFYNKAKHADDLGYTNLAQGALAGVVYHELLHSAGIYDEAQTLSLTNEFFTWLQDTYIQPQSPAYEQAEIAAAYGGSTYI
ncbi:MAG: hypothetical protein ACMXYK_03295 [Candidatus Woesearchaeota archaeon]